MRQLVDEGDLGAAVQDCVEVHLGHGGAPVDQLPAGDDGQTLEQGGGVRPPVGLDEADDDVGAAFGAAGPLGEHRDGLADAGRCSEVDPQSSSGHGAIVTDPRARQALPRGRH